MSANRWIPYSLMPPHFPGHLTLTLVLAWRVLGGPQWLWGIIWFLIALWWIATAVVLFEGDAINKDAILKAFGVSR